jgi:ring-1,2-phenylacetyl-CoA epoxidase subunit PaaD
MVTRDAIFDVLKTIDDPEMPITIVDLGIVEDVRIDETSTPAAVEIDILPTFVGCPALPVIEETIQKKVGALNGVGAIRVHFKFDPPWSVDRISAEGRASLKEYGLTVPHRMVAAEPEDEPEVPACPFCGSAQVRLESPFGPTRCRMIYYCEACRNPFEHLKRVSLSPLAIQEQPSKR